MLISWVIEILVEFATALVNLLPSGSVAISGSVDGSSIATSVLNVLGAISGLVPVELALYVLYATIAAIPLVLLFLLFEWGYDHMPTVLGTGS